MTTRVLCNVGERDVTLDGNVLSPPRQRGEEALSDYANVADRLSLPIIVPCLDYILAQQPDAIEVYLFGTDQTDPAHRSADTVHTAKLAARYLRDRYGPRLGSCEARSISGINPALYDEAFEAFDHLLSTLSVRPDDACYVILCGGTPACNFALLLQGIRHYQNRLRAIYLPQGGEPQELRVGQQLITTFDEVAAISHLRRFDFSSARLSLEKLAADPGLVLLVVYAEQRLAFDFAGAQQTLLAALRDGNQTVRTFINKHLRHDLDNLLNADDSRQQLLALLKELFWNASITYEQHRYADFLGRVYRFQEAVLRYLVETIFGLPTDMNASVRATNQDRWEAGIRANKWLHDFLKQHTIGENGRALDWTVVGRPTYQAMLSFALQGGNGPDGRPLLNKNQLDLYKVLIKRVGAFDRLVELRHRTIIGHGFEGISEDTILSSYSHKTSTGRSMTPVDGLAEIMRMLSSLPASDPYRRIVDFVVQCLQLGTYQEEDSAAPSPHDAAPETPS